MEVFIFELFGTKFGDARLSNIRFGAFLVTEDSSRLKVKFLVEGRCISDEISGFSFK